MSEDDIWNIKDAYMKINIPECLLHCIEEAVAKGRESYNSSRKPQKEEPVNINSKL